MYVCMYVCMSRSQSYTFRLLEREREREREMSRSVVVDCEMSSLATIKALLHSTKYASKPVIGLLIGTSVEVRRRSLFFRRRKRDIFTFVFTLYMYICHMIIKKCGYHSDITYPRTNKSR